MTATGDAGYMREKAPTLPRHQTDQPGTVLGWAEPVEEQESALPAPLPPLLRTGSLKP